MVFSQAAAAARAAAATTTANVLRLPIDCCLSYLFIKRFPQLVAPHGAILHLLHSTKVHAVRAATLIRPP
jgi:hypothetical protein